MTNREFAEKIYSIRTAQGLSQKELGDMLGVSNKAVSKWETGDSMPKTATLVKIAETFNVDISELMGGEQKETAPDKSAELNSLKAENALLRSQITTTKKRKRLGIFAAVILCIAAIAGAGIFAFLTGTSIDNKGLNDLGKSGTYVDFAGKEFEPFEPLDALVYQNLAEDWYFSDTKEAAYTDLSGTKSKALVCCDNTVNYITLQQGSKNYYYIADGAHIKIQASQIDDIVLHYGKSVATTNGSDGYHYEVVAQKEFTKNFIDFYKNKKETADKRATELYLGNKGFAVEIELDEAHDWMNFKIGEFFVGKDKKVYFYDYSDAKTYDVGKEMAKYVKGD